MHVRAGVGVEAPAGDGEGLVRAWVAAGDGMAEGAGMDWGAQPHKAIRASSRGRSRKGMGSPPLHGMLGTGERMGIFGGKHTWRRQAPAAPNHGALILRFYILDAVVGQQMLPVSEIA